LLFAGVACDSDGVCSEGFSLLFQCIEAFLPTGGENEPGAFAS
jgi:hypothetical protein